MASTEPSGGPASMAAADDPIRQPFAEQESASEASQTDLSKGLLDQEAGMLDLGRGITLALGKDALVVTDASTKKNKNRTCGFGLGPSAPTTQSIPYYNILWAEHDAAAQPPTLTIDYASEVSKTRLGVAKLTHHPPTTSLDATGIFVASLLDRAYGPARRRKRAYVLVNPHAGPGGAERVWAAEVEPLFAAARMALTVVRTRYSGEAVGLAEALDVAAYDAVVACSGDGLPHEVFNGLARRPDARRALGSLAVAHVPCGSGNAMSCNLYGTHRPGPAALAIVKGVATPLDLVSLTQGDRRTISFLSQAVGVVAEADLATEHMRWMGQSRFTLGFLQRVFERKVYPCDIAVKVEIEHKDGVKAHYRRERAGSAGADGALGLGLGGDGKTEDGTLGRREVVGFAGESESPASGSDDDGMGLPPLRYGTVNDKLPEGWELVPYDKMGNFYCGNMAYMAPDANFFSAAFANDGFMDMVHMDGDMSPFKAIQMLLSVESGHFFDHPLVSYRKVSAYRLIPRGQETGYISIDGERVPFEPFQCEVHRGLGTVISRRGGYEAPGPRGWDKVTVAERLHA